MSNDQNEQKVKSDMSRRGFLKTGSLAMGTMVLGGLVAGCGDDVTKIVKSGSDNSTPPPMSWDKSTDVVVVGYGGAGAAAAWAARTAGAQVTLIERAEVAGGSSNINGGLITLGAGTPVQKAAGFNDTADLYYQYLVAAGGSGTSTDHCKVLADDSLALYDWLVNTCGVKFPEGYLDQYPAEDNPTAGLACTGDEFQWDYASKITPMSRSHWVNGQTPEGASTGGRNGSGVFQPIKRTLEKLSPEIIYKTKVTRLVYDSKLERVVGVVMQEQTGDNEFKGQEVYVQAKRAVILTAGGFTNNEEMVKLYCPQIIGSRILGTAGDDGTGIRMGMAVGASVAHMGDAYGFANIGSLLARHSVPGGPLTYGIAVNALGQRFFAEDHYNSFLPIAMWTVRFEEDFNPAYFICDATTWNGIPDASKPTTNIVAQADSIAALATALKTVDGVLEATIAHYNQYAVNDSNKDPLFHKNDKFVREIKTAPFYALKLTATGGSFTWGGLRINTSGQVLSALTQEPVAGLYAAGRTAIDIFGTFYQGSGLSVASCYTFGRIAGAKAGAEKPWTEENSTTPA